MRKLIVWEFLSLDGVMESPEKWVDFYSGDDVADFIRDENLSCDAMILGRLTYEAFITFWPSQTNNEFGFAEKLNAMPKYVVSSTLKSADWNNTSIIHGDVVQEITALKAQPGGHIGMTGSATLVQDLLPTGVIDELHLLVFPLTRGNGLRLFVNGPALGMKLVESRVFASGVVLLSYQVEGEGS